MPANHTPTPAQSWMIRLAHVCWEREKFSVIVVVTSVSAILPAALTSLLTRQVVNDALTGNPARLPWLACGLLLIVSFDFIGNYVRRGYAGMLSLWMQHTFRRRVFGSIQEPDGADQDTLRTERMISRTNSDLQQVHTLLQMCPVSLAVFTYYVTGIAVMLWMSPVMTLIVMCVLVCSAVTVLRAHRRVFAQTGMASDQLANLIEHIRKVLAQILVVKSYVVEMCETYWLDGQSRQITRVRIDAVTSQATPGATVLALLVLGQITLLCYSEWSIVHGRIDLGTFVAFASFPAMPTRPTRVPASFLVIAQRTRAPMRRVFALTGTHSQMKDGMEPTNSQAVGLKLENMSFDYRHGDKHILSDISFSLRAGGTVTVVGASGLGESTLLMLLAHFYDPRSGKIRLNTNEGRQNPRDTRLKVFRHRAGIVFEDAFLFAGTVAENIAYGHPQTMADDIRHAAAAAGTSDFINTLSKGFDSLLTEQGTNLSGGQRQRTVLARTLIITSNVLILDGTTSAVGTATEAEINIALGCYADERHTLLVIVRRRSTLQLISRAVAPDRGRMVDIGTPAEPEARCPTFCVLMTGDSDFLATSHNSHNELWPTEPTI